MTDLIEMGSVSAVKTVAALIGGFRGVEGGGGGGGGGGGLSSCIIPYTESQGPQNEGVKLLDGVSK